MKNDDYMMILERIMKLAIPNVYGWILMFYGFFHCWMNFLAELTRFSDRNFYKDWWNSIYLDQYWRTWNLVIFKIIKISLMCQCIEFFYTFLILTFFYLLLIFGSNHIIIFL